MHCNQHYPTDMFLFTHIFSTFQKTFVNPLERYRFVSGVDDGGTEGFDGKQLLYDASMGIGCL